MSAIDDKLNLCRTHLCDALTDLMDFVEGSGYVEPSNIRLFTIYKQVSELIDSIDLFLD